MALLALSSLQRLQHLELGHLSWRQYPPSGQILPVNTPAGLLVNLQGLTYLKVGVDLCSEQYCLDEDYGSDAVDNLSLSVFDSVLRECCGLSGLVGLHLRVNNMFPIEAGGLPAQAELRSLPCLQMLVLTSCFGLGIDVSCMHRLGSSLTHVHFEYLLGLKPSVFSGLDLLQRLACHSVTLTDPLALLKVLPTLTNLQDLRLPELQLPPVPVQELSALFVGQQLRRVSVCGLDSGPTWARMAAAQQCAPALCALSVRIESSLPGFSYAGLVKCCPNLEELRLTQRTAAMLVALQPLTGLRHLTSLQVDGHNRLHGDYKHLAMLTSLHRLVLGPMIALDDFKLESLQELTALKQLTLLLASHSYRLKVSITAMRAGLHVA